MSVRTAEMAFLPAALEVAVTPPLPASRAIAWSIMLLFLVTVAWASVARVDVVGVANGKIVPLGQVKHVQPFETAIVQAINVHEGQTVARNEVLVELDAAAPRADLNNLLEQRAQVADEQTRLNALLRGFGTEATSPEARTQHHPTLQLRIANNYRSFAAERQALDDESRRNRAERRSIEASLAQANATLPLLAERADALRQLHEKSVGPRLAWLELEERRTERDYERAILATQLQVNDASFAQLAQRRVALVARTDSQWRSELAEVTTRASVLDHEISKARARVDRFKLRAPVSGTVQQLAVNTVGGVVSTAETLMLLVPSGALGVEAWVENKDIGFVTVGQSAKIKIETFPFTRYGSIQGHIETLSLDAVSSPERGLTYLAQVSMAQSTLDVNGRPVKLSAGMAVSVEVNLGRRRVTEFLLAPLLRYRDEGLGER